ncbi:hypothetical protein NQ318_002675 [Aromia moschata]|uniref:Uncharacterized protein n=1 Tax=Aromia moschata TaxID=1265417 RepID=A0AAV8XTT3_9CUCU|nr:hypothetical protein NQ318_002675 [Aromia moschata]
MIWSKQWLLKRQEFSHINFLVELTLEKRRLNDNVVREAITCHERLTATLRFLATGRSYEDLKYSTVISPEAMCYVHDP